MKKRIQQEQQVVAQMIRLYCRQKEKNDTLCADCEELLHYAHSRLERCRFGEGKPTCRKCPIHCYRPDMKKRIQAVMAYSGPRMLFHHPWTALLHLWREFK